MCRPGCRRSTGRHGYTVTESGIAVVPVLGPLVARGDWLTTLLGASEYGAIADALTAAADDPAVRGIVLEVDSPGGEVGGLFDLVDAIGAIRQRSAKPLWAVASEAALSAAYAIASAADRLYVTRTGEVGSVGVVAVHLDESGADAMAGLKWTLIHAGARKTDGNPHEPLSPRATADIQADVDALYDAAGRPRRRQPRPERRRRPRHRGRHLPRRAGGQGRPRRSGRHRRAGHRRSGGGAGDASASAPARPRTEPPFANPHHPQGPSP